MRILKVLRLELVCTASGRAASAGGVRKRSSEPRSHYIKNYVSMSVNQIDVNAVNERTRQEDIHKKACTPHGK
jgi:hypothetical protein